MTIKVLSYAMAFSFVIGMAIAAGAILVIAGAIEACDWFRSRPQRYL